MNNKPTALYRHYDAEGKLLYVGISLSAVQRLQSHRSNSKWESKIHRMDIKYFESREAALIAEAEAIKKENPVFNIVHNRPTALAKPKQLAISEKNVRFRGEIREALRSNRYSLTASQQELFIDLVHMFEDGETKYYIECDENDALIVFRNMAVDFLVIKDHKIACDGWFCVFSGIERSGDGTLFSTHKEAVDFFIEERNNGNIFLKKWVRNVTGKMIKINVPKWKLKSLP